MTSSSLKLLFETIDQAQNEQVLRSRVVPKIGEYFSANRRAIFFFDQVLSANRKFQNILNLALSIEHNPIARYLSEHHAPVHEALVTSPKAWKLICPRPDHWHVLAGPILDRGQLIGVVGCTREKLMPAFDTQDLSDLSGICLHLSVWVSAKRNLLHRGDRLTPRELQIAELVALGRTNAEIGKQLWITENSVKQALKRMFRKLEVSSRTEMIAQIFTVS
ncbi:MAG TPA: LuxR C-terminal-related transcriptional regulator [Leptolyngbya sp.]|jgi:DNA-binding CsgD family transcriptional regulator|nr:LuxR C-terminal-related transcriptional regulator [Leptolyngbya sp.]